MKNFVLTMKDATADLLFFASVCFSIGSFVLAEPVKLADQWLLLALGALSLTAGFAARCNLLSWRPNKANIKGPKDQSFAGDAL